MLDLKDKKIIYELGLNARITNKALAKKIMLSESSTIARINRLFEEEILLGTHTLIDNSKMGYQGYRLYFKFFSTTPKEENEILEWLKNNPSVSVLARCFGFFDVAVMSWVKERALFDNLITFLKENFRDKITNLEISLYCETYHFNRDYLFENSPKQRKMIKTGEGKIESYDKLDEKILNLLYDDARKNIIDLSSKLNTPPRTISYRIKQLEKKGIIAGYNINLQTKKIGYTYYKLNIILSKNAKFSDILNFAISNKNVIYLDRTIGVYDLQLNIEIKDNEELQKVIEKIKTTFGGIKELSWFQIDKYLKIVYI